MTKTEETLKNCKICGSNKIPVFHTKSEPHRVWCLTCGYKLYGQGHADLKEAWNTRTDTIKPTLLDSKYFASDHDKFLFWIKDGKIVFEKFSSIYGHLCDAKRKPLYDVFKNLPYKSWDTDTIKPTSEERQEAMGVLQDYIMDHGEHLTEKGNALSKLNCIIRKALSAPDDPKTLCVAGCTSFYGGELKHHTENMSKLYDDALEKPQRTKPDENVPCDGLTNIDEVIEKMKMYPEQHSHNIELVRGYNRAINDVLTKLKEMKDK